MLVRRFTERDLTDIEKLNPFAAVQIKYDQGVSAENVFCAEEGGLLAAVGFFTVHQTLNTKKLKLTHFICSDDSRQGKEAESLVMDGLLKRFQEIKEDKLSTEVFFNAYCEADQIEYIQFLLQKGFCMNAAVPVLKFDLTGDIPHHPLPKGVVIQKLEFDGRAMQEYLRANALSNTDLDAESDLWFHTGDSSFSCYAAKCDGEIAGAVSVWNITEERGATENIFVLPQYRRKNIARELIAAAFEELKDRGMKFATLSLLGTNLPAMKLYLSTGYKLYYNLIEMRYE